MATTKTPKSKAKNAYELLSEVRALILAEPKRYDQGSYIERGTCGTVGCVAGWVATLKSKRKFGYFETSSIAANVLGLNADQQHKLFSGCAVSEDFKPRTREHAIAGAQHIAVFQQANREQLFKTKV